MGTVSVLSMMNAMNASIKKFLVVTFSCLFVTVYASSIEKQQETLAHYVHRTYTSMNGMPHNSARAIVQMPDGYLWVATQNGLARFYGTGFQVFDKSNTPALHHNDITALAVSPDSTLWIGTYNGLTSLKHGVFTFHKTGDGPSMEIIRALAIDHSGNVLIGTMNDGLKIYKNGTVESITTVHGLSNNTVYAVVEDQKENIWIGTEMGLNKYHNGQFSYYHMSNGLPHEMVRSLSVSSDGTLWIGTMGGLVKWNNGIQHTYTAKDGLSDIAIRSIYEDHSGTLWVGTELGGICQFTHNAFIPYRASDGLLGNMVVAIFEDREGILWVGIYNNGLDQFWEGKFLNYDMRDGLPTNGAASIIQARDGGIWIGSGDLTRFDGRKFKTFGNGSKPLTTNVRALFEDSRGTVWIGTQSGLLQYSNGTFRTYSEKDGLSNLQIRAIREDHQGHLWVGTLAGGAHRMEHGRLVSFQDKGLSINVIRCIFVDHAGTVWITSNDGVRLWRNDTITMFTKKEGLPEEPIYEMIEDSENTLWMGSYGGGLVRYRDGKFTRYTQQHGLINDAIFQLVEDNFGNLWLGGMKGISYIKKQQLNDFAEGKIDRIQSTGYTAADGMISSDCNSNAQATCCKTSDGRLWFTTNAGIVVVDPGNLHENMLPPPVMIEKIYVNKAEFSPLGNIHVPSGNGEVEIHYSGLSFQVPEKVRFRYILEGFDKEWNNVETRHEAFYTNLPPGKYTFCVLACNNDGIWNTTGARVSFELEPHVYQTAWFFGLMLVVAGGAIFGMYRIRVWRLLIREKMLKAYVTEAMAKIKVLNGLIPICASCKKIRDDKGYWSQLEEYINAHSEATFSHGVCPECADKLYGKYLTKIKNEQGPTLSDILPKEKQK